VRPHHRFITTAALMLCTAAGIMAQTPAQAREGPAVTTQSAVYVERVEPGSARRLEPVSHLSRGDRVVTVLTWQWQSGEERGFIITNPLPASLAYQRSTSDAQEVSVDGGRTWGHIGNLRIGSRFATPEDVTHVRWRITASRAMQGRGQIAYAGIVR